MCSKWYIQKLCVHRRRGKRESEGERASEGERESERARERERGRESEGERARETTVAVGDRTLRVLWELRSTPS